MSPSLPATLKRTALHARHQKDGARLVEYAGWEMPVEYSGITDEHLAVRTRAGLFDVSHMGQVELAGPDALAAVQWLTSNDASKLVVGQAQYSALTTPDGTFVDDVLVYRLADDHYLLVINAGNVAKAHQWIVRETQAVGGDVSVVNTSARYALIALQGPAAEEILQPLTGVELPAIRYYRFATGEVAGARATISRTGYTGEDGFELFVPPAQAEKTWAALMEAGRSADLKPCGLGARDTLRLEACMRLYGNEMDETVTVLEAGLGWIVGWKKDRFIGADRLREQQAQGVRRKLVAFEMVDRAIARHGYPVLQGDTPCGVVTSGTQTPFLKKAIGMAMVPVDLAESGTSLVIDVRGRRAAARVVPEPFYARPKRAAAQS
jgi:aminomethyltransferase